MNYFESLLEYPHPKEFLEWLVQLGLHELSVSTLPALHKIFSTSGDGFDFMSWLSKNYPEDAGAIIDMFVKSSVPYFVNSVKNESTAMAYVNLYFERKEGVEL